MNRVLDGLIVSVSLGRETHSDVESIDCVVKHVEGHVATLTSRAPIRTHVKERLARGAGGFLVLDDNQGLIALRGMAVGIANSADFHFVALDGTPSLPDAGSAPRAGGHHIVDGVRLFYISQAKDDLSEADFAQILTVAREKNRHAELTGALCYRAGFFAQVLEGPQTALWELYNRIEHDDRHTDPVIVAEEPATERLYTGWLMKGIDSDTAITAADELIARKGLADRDDTPQLLRRWLALLSSQSGPAWRSDWLAAKHSVVLVRELVERSAQTRLR